MHRPFADNPYFEQSCEICEAYTGNEHFYGDCQKCPVYKMAEKLEVTEKELKKIRFEMSWNDFPERMGR